MTARDEAARTAGLRLVLESLRRNKGTWALVRVEGQRAPTMLMLGAPTATKLREGFVVAIGCSREELTKLRDAIDVMLDSGDSVPS